jgi:hypothetical protein
MGWSIGHFVLVAAPDTPLHPLTPAGAARPRGVEPWHDRVPQGESYIAMIHPERGAQTANHKPTPQGEGGKNQIENNNNKSKTLLLSRKRK